MRIEQEILECIDTLIKFYIKNFDFKLKTIQHEVELLKHSENSNTASLIEWQECIDRNIVV